MPANSKKPNIISILEEQLEKVTTDFQKNEKVEMAQQEYDKAEYSFDRVRSERAKEFNKLQAAKAKVDGAQFHLEQMEDAKQSWHKVNPHDLGQSPVADEVKDAERNLREAKNKYYAEEKNYYEYNNNLHSKFETMEKNLLEKKTALDKAKNEQKTTGFGFGKWIDRILQNHLPDTFGQVEKGPIETKKDFLQAEKNYNTKLAKSQEATQEYESAKKQVEDYKGKLGAIKRLLNPNLQNKLARAESNLDEKLKNLETAQAELAQAEKHKEKCQQAQTKMEGLLERLKSEVQKPVKAEASQAVAADAKQHPTLESPRRALSPVSGNTAAASVAEHRTVSAGDMKAEVTRNREQNSKRSEPVASEPAAPETPSFRRP